MSGGFVMSMHRLLAFLIVAFGVLASPATAAETMPYADGVLWRIEGAGGTLSHVFGTLHSSDERITSLPEAVSEAFAPSETLAIEVVLDNAANFKIGRAMMLPGDKRLDALLTPQQVAQLKDVVAHYHMPFAMVTRFKPWGAMILFSYPPAELLRSAAGKKPLDEVLRERAEATGKKVLGLETVDEQIETLDGMMQADQLLLLDSTLEQAGEIERMFATLRDAYLARDLVAVYDLLNAAKAGDDTGAIERFEQRLIIDRNRRMVERMDALLQQGGAFVAVGALHLPGRQGILQLLADQGYQVTRVY
jgi:uncharacterized protein YbaP (TraB family)